MEGRGCPDRGETKAHMHGKDGLVTVEAEPWGSASPGQRVSSPAGSTRNQERGLDRLPAASPASRGASPADTVTLNFWIRE